MGRPPKKNLPAELRDALQIVGANIASLRESKGFTQRELASRSNTSFTTLNEIETRRFRDIRLSTLANIAAALDVTIADLIAKSDVKLSKRESIRLLKASEDILRIAKRARTTEES